LHQIQVFVVHLGPKGMEVIKGLPGASKINQKKVKKVVDLSKPISIFVTSCQSW
jgi:hypothetical protein